MFRVFSVLSCRLCVVMFVVFTVCCHAHMSWCFCAITQVRPSAWGHLVDLFVCHAAGVLSCSWCSLSCHVCVSWCFCAITQARPSAWGHLVDLFVCHVVGVLFVVFSVCCHACVSCCFCAVTQVSPVSGPVLGGTMLTLSGTDFGSSNSQEVTVGNTTCLVHNVSSRR